MNKNRIKLLSLLLALCAVLSLSAPAVSAEDTDTAADTAAEEEFVFPEFGNAYSLGEALLGGMSLTEYAVMVEKNDNHYLMASAKGGTLYVLKLSEFLRGEDGAGTFIEAAINHGIPVPRGIVVDSLGVSYTIGDANYVFCYDFYRSTTSRINISGASRAITIDKDDNLYVGQEQKIIKIDTRNNNKQTELCELKEISFVGAMHWGDNGDLYVCGPRAGFPNGYVLYRLDSNTGAVKKTFLEEQDPYGFYLSYIDGVLFAGHSDNQNEAQVFDAETLTPIDLGLPNWIMGVVTTPNEEGKSYLQVNANGIYEYDTKTRTAKRAEGLVAWEINLRIRDAYLDVDYDGIKGKCIVTMASGHGLPSILSIEGQGFRELEELVEESTSPAEIRTVATAVPGVKVPHSNADALTGTPQEAAVYIGAYLSGNVGAYYPDAVEPGMRIDSQIFSNGHAQTDSMLVYKDKLYAGVYNGGYLLEYDPATDTEIQLIPEGLKDKYGQIRIHSLDAADDKIFFSTIPGHQALGGAIGWYDLATGEVFVERNVVPDQSVISIVYDEERKLLFGASSVAGGTQSVPTQDQAKLLVYDVENRKVLGNFSIMSSENPNSDMVFDLTGKDVLPRYISGIAQDPDTGKFWGLVCHTLFSFEYDEKTNTMKVHEEYAHGVTPKSLYPNGGSLQWFPRNFAFDGKGNFYLFLNNDQLYRFSTADVTKPVAINRTVAGRPYALGTDGNLYVGYGTELYKIALNRVDIVKGMIDGVEPRFQDEVKLTRQCYEALTDEEKAQISEEYMEGLVALEGAAKIFLQVQADKVIEAIDAIGAVTVTSEGAVAAARMEYDFLSEDGKALVTNYQDLLNAEAKFQEISAASSWGRLEQIPVVFSRGVNTRLGETPLQMTTFDHINGGIWEYAISSGTPSLMKYNGMDHLQLNFSGRWIAFRVKIGEPGLYSVILNSKGGNKPVVDGGLYMFDTTGIKSDFMYDLVHNEVSLVTPNTQNYVCSLDYSVVGESKQGQWYCEKPGEYLLVLNNLNTDTGEYGRPVSITFTKRDATPDAAVELAKERIDAIGKVNKNSGDKINDARITYDALSDAQKALIYAPSLEKAELAFEEVKKQQAEKDSKNAVEAAMVKAYIDAIGTVTEKSGPAIEMARKEYDKLSKDAKDLVVNKDVLLAAEEAFAKFNQDGGNGEGGNGMLTYILIGAGALVVILVIVLIAAKGKKKKTAPEAAEEAAEEAASEEATEE